MLKIKIPKGVEKLEIPMGIYVNGFIIKATMHQPTKSMLELNNRVNTHVHTDHKGD
jgi:hypothetical protein